MRITTAPGSKRQGATLRVEFSPAAEADLKSLYDYVADESPRRALSYVQDIRARCDRLGETPLVGTLRPEIFPDLRIVGFQRRVAICFRVTQQAVQVLRVLYGGRDLEAALSGTSDE